MRRRESVPKHTTVDIGVDTRSILDVTLNKNVLYCVVTVDELKRKIELYERIKRRSRIESRDFLMATKHY